MIKSELIQKIAATNQHLYHRDIERIDTIVLVTITAVIHPTGTDITVPVTTMVALDITGTDLAITATGTTARAHTTTAVIAIVFAAEVILAFGPMPLAAM